MTGTLHIQHGQVVCYRTYDAAEEFDLTRASQALMDQVASRASFRRVKPAHLQVQDPPLQVRMGTTKVTAGDTTLDGEVILRLFATGVASVGLWLVLPPGTPLEDLPRLVARLNDNVEVDNLCASMVRRLMSTVGAAAKAPRQALGVMEDYCVVLVRSFDRDIQMTELRRAPALAAILLGEEADAPPLSRQALRAALGRSLSYYGDELVLMDWNAAFVFDPRGGEDVADILEFTTQQLVEFRYYDAFLDTQLDRIYDEVEKRARKPFRSLLGGDWGRLATDLMMLRVELTEVTEKIDNSLKLAGEPFLARVYLAAVERFRIPQWRVSVEEKITLIDELVGLVRGEITSQKSVALETAVVLLIVLEIVITLTGIAQH